MEYIDRLMELIDDDSILVRKKVVEEIEILYLKSKDEFLAHAYIFSLLKLSQLQDAEDFYKTTKIAEGIYKKFKTFEVAYIYCDLLYILSTKVGKDIVAENLEKLKEVYNTFTCDEVSVYRIAILALANESLAIKKEDIDIEIVEAEKILEKHKSDFNVEHYVKTLCYVCLRPDVEDTLVYITKIKEFYNTNSRLAEYYSSSLVKEAGNEDKTRSLLAITELENIYKTYKSYNTVSNYGFGLYNTTLDCDPKQCVENIEKIESLEKELKRPDFIEMYSESLRNLSTHKNEKYNEFAKGKLLTLLKNEKDKKVKEFISLQYCITLYNTMAISTIEIQTEILFEILKNYLEMQSTKILDVYRTAVIAICKNYEKEDIVFIIDKLYTFSKGENIDFDIYSDFLNGYIWIIKDLNDYYKETNGEESYGITNEKCIENAQYIFEKYENEQTISLFSSLIQISTLNKYYENIDYLEEKMKNLYFKYSNEKMAEEYLLFISNNVSELVDKADILTDIDKAKEIYESFKNKDTAAAFATVFYRLADNEHFENYKYGFNILENLYNTFENVMIGEVYLSYIGKCMRYYIKYAETFLLKAEEIYNRWKDGERSQFFETNYVITCMEYYYTLQEDEGIEIFENIKNICSNSEHSHNKEMYEHFLDSLSA